MTGEMKWPNMIHWTGKFCVKKDKQKQQKATTFEAYFLRIIKNRPYVIKQISRTLILTLLSLENSYDPEVLKYVTCSLQMSPYGAQEHLRSKKFKRIRLIGWAHEYNW